MDKTLNNAVEKLIPELSKMIDQALPEDLQRAFSDYTFLTLFHALPPGTPRGIVEAKKIVSRWKAQARSGG
jgi:hypothetical protein